MCFIIQNTNYGTIGALRKNIMRKHFNSDACGRDLKQYPYKQTVAAKGQPSYLSICISYENFLSNSEASLLLEIFMNSETHQIQRWNLSMLSPPAAV